MIDSLIGKDVIPSVRTVQNVAYLIRNRASSKVYVGSTCHPGGRVSAHRSNLHRGVHENKNLQALYNESPNIDFVFYEVTSRESAYELEKALIDHFHEKGELLNIALDPVDHKLTPEMYAALRVGRVKNTAVVSVPVTVDGVEYTSVRDAARQYTVSHSSVLNRIASAKKKYAGWFFTGKPKASVSNNGAKNAIIVRVGGHEYTLSEYSRHTGIPFPTLQWRMKLGIKDEELHMPVKRNGNYAKNLGD